MQDRLPSRQCVLMLRCMMDELPLFVGEKIDCYRRAAELTVEHIEHVENLLSLDVSGICAMQIYQFEDGVMEGWEPVDIPGRIFASGRYRKEGE